MRISPLTPTIGADIFDVDLSVSSKDLPLSDISQAFLRYHVLFFRNQEMTPEDIVRFARLFGPVGAYPFAEPLPNHPEVIAIIKEPEQRTVFGGIWHTDSTYLATPSLASVLYAVEVPDLGGDTLFANMHAAWEHLDPELQNKLRHLKAFHSSVKNRSVLRADHLQGGSMKGETSPELQASHPLVRQHPDSGRLSLYISPAHTVRIEGLPEAESDELLGSLYQHALQDDFKCRFRWSPGTLAIWDNRCTLHYPVNDYHGQRREMYRVTIEGSAPVSKMD